MVSITKLRDLTTLLTNTFPVLLCLTRVQARLNAPSHARHTSPSSSPPRSRA